jgi:preprotein translocase subunit SecE
MAMNREQKRAMQRAGQLHADGTPIRERRDPAARVKADRTSPAQFVTEVRAEMRKVAWPTRAETLRLSLIVFVAILVLGTFIFVADIAFGQVTDFLFPTPSVSNAAALAPSLFL